MPKPALLALPAFAFPFQPCSENPAGASAGGRAGGPGGQHGAPQPSAAGSLGGGARPAPGACRQPGKSLPGSVGALQAGVGEGGVGACRVGAWGEGGGGAESGRGAASQESSVNRQQPAGSAGCCSLWASAPRPGQFPLPPESHGLIAAAEH